LKCSIITTQKYSNVNKCYDLFSMNKQDNVVFGITAHISESHSADSLRTINIYNKNAQHT